MTAPEGTMGAANAATPARLYTPKQVRAACLGSILCSAHLIAANWRRLGNPAAAARAWVIATATFAAVLLIAQVVPDEATAQVSTLAAVVYLAAAEILQKGQRADVALRIAGGARSASGWSVFGLIACYVSAVILAIALLTSL